MSCDWILSLYSGKFMEMGRIRCRYFLLGHQQGWAEGTHVEFILSRWLLPIGLSVHSIVSNLCFVVVVVNRIIKRHEDFGRWPLCPHLTSFGQICELLTLYSLLSSNHRPSSSSVIIKISSLPLRLVSKSNIDPLSISLFWECDPIPDHRTNKQVVFNRKQRDPSFNQGKWSVEEWTYYSYFNFRQNQNSSVSVPHCKEGWQRSLISH